MITEKTPLSSFETGLKCRCPRCGQGKLFTGLLSLRKNCLFCGLDYDFADAADGPSVFVTFIVGIIVTGGALWLEFGFNAPLWLHLVVWPPITFALCLAFLRPLKAIMVAQQYKHDAREGRQDTSQQGEN